MNPEAQEAHVKITCSLATVDDCGMTHPSCIREGTGTCHGHVTPTCEAAAAYRLRGPQDEYNQYACTRHISDMQRTFPDASITPIKERQ